MVEKQKKEDTLLAIILSLLTIVFGAALWGFLYTTGYFFSWLALFISAFSVLLYTLKKPSGNAGMMVYIVLASVVLNYASMIFAESIRLYLALNEFTTFWNLMLTTVKSSWTLGIVDTLTCIGFTVLGALMYYLIFKIRHNKQRERIEKEVMEDANAKMDKIFLDKQYLYDSNVSNDPKAKFKEICVIKYKAMLEAFETMVSVYKRTGDKQAFATEYTNLKLVYINSMSVEEISEVTNLARIPFDELEKEVARKMIMKILESI